MKPQTNFGELQSLIYNVVKDCIENKKYEVKLLADYSSTVAGYIEGYVNFAGMDFRASFNTNGYCSWHVGEEIKPIFELFTESEEEDLVKAAYKEKENRGNEELIKKYEARIASLKQTI